MIHTAAARTEKNLCVGAANSGTTAMLLRRA